MTHPRDSNVVLPGGAQVLIFLHVGGANVQAGLRITALTPQKSLLKKKKN